MSARRARSCARAAVVVGCAVVSAIASGVTASGAIEKPGPMPGGAQTSVVTPPTNDDLAGATAISGLSGCQSDTTVGASSEAGEYPSGVVASALGTSSVWYDWTAPSDTTITFALYRLTSVNNSLAVFTGSDVSSLTVVGYQAPDEASVSVEFAASSGVHYLIQVASDPGLEGTFALEWGGGCPAPSNDDFANATPLAGATGALAAQSNNKATQQSQESPVAESDTRSVWYEWTAPSGDPVTFRTRRQESLSDSTLGVYTGSALDQASSVVVNDDYGAWVESQLSFTPTQGETYRIRVAGYGESTGQFSLEWGSFPGVTVALPPGSTGFSASPTVRFIATFTEPVSDFTSSDVSTWPYSSSPEPDTVVVTDTGDHVHFTIDVTANQEGYVGVFVPAGSADGATASSSTSNFVRAKFDQTAPALGSMSGKVKGSQLSLTFSATDDSTVSFECAVDGAAYTACSSPWNTKVAKGSHAAYVRAIDSAGNSTVSPGYAFTIKSGRIKP